MTTFSSCFDGPANLLSLFLCRLEDIAADAELQEKSLSELGRLVSALREGCSQAETEHARNAGLDPDYDPKKDKGAGFTLGGVLINVPSVRKREEELATLAACVPEDPQARKRFVGGVEGGVGGLGGWTVR